MVDMLIQRICLESQLQSRILNFYSFRAFYSLHKPISDPSMDILFMFVYRMLDNHRIVEIHFLGFQRIWKIKCKLCKTFN